TDTKLAGQVQSAFKGETLRGLLLNAYAFGKMGQIALIAGIAALAAAAALMLLALLGYAHLRTVNAEVEVMPKLGAHAAVKV
ncbi:MAG: hypothetical protein QOG10_1877, partial [Kribbellaceae bacterium]|nr:hypothetical protein [Kribbellaceae bacterium]